MLLYSENLLEHLRKGIWLRFLCCYFLRLNFSFELTLSAPSGLLLVVAAERQTSWE